MHLFLFLPIFCQTFFSVSIDNTIKIPLGWSGYLYKFKTSSYCLLTFEVSVILTVFLIQMRCRYNFWRWDSQVENLNASWTLIFWQPLHIFQGSYLGGYVAQEISMHFAENFLLFPVSRLFFSYIPCSLASTVWLL